MKDGGGSRVRSLLALHWADHWVFTEVRLREFPHPLTILMSH